MGVGVGVVFGAVTKKGGQPRSVASQGLEAGDGVGWNFGVGVSLGVGVGLKIGLFSCAAEETLKFSPKQKNVKAKKQTMFN